MGLVSDFRADIEHATGRPAGVWQVLAYPWVVAGARAVLCYRIAHRLRRVPGFRPVAAMVKRFALLTTGAEIHPAAQIGPGLHLPHPTGVVIGANTKIHGPCAIFQQVTLGPRKSEADPDDGPTLEAGVSCFAGARVIGPVTLGEGTDVGPNCVVYRSVPAGTTIMPPAATVLEGLNFSRREPQRHASEPQAAEVAS